MRCQDNGGLSIGNATRVERSHPQLDFITASTDGIPEGLDELLAPGVEGAFHSREEFLVRGGAVVLQVVVRHDGLQLLIVEVHVAVP